MQKFIIIIIILLMILPTKSILPIAVSLETEDLEAYGVAGLLAYLPVSKADPVAPPVTACQCNKATGKISYDGGTSLTDCPCKNGECGCRKPAGATFEEKFPRVVLVTQPRSCVPCRSVEKNIIVALKNDSHKKAGWIVGNTRDCHLQVLDLDSKSDVDEIASLGIEIGSIPSFYFIRKSGVEKTFTGSMSYKDYIGWAKSSESVKKK